MKLNRFLLATSSVLLLAAMGRTPPPDVSAPYVPPIKPESHKPSSRIIHDSEFPQFTYYEEPVPVWYTYKTDQGCLYWVSQFPEDHPHMVLESAEWKGDRCIAGQYITGTGTLTETMNDESIRDEITAYMTGTMEDGVFQGPMVFSSTGMLPDRKETVQMFGGCQEGNMFCRPRHRVKR